jgi:hypothetical protein
LRGLRLTIAGYQNAGAATADLRRLVTAVRCGAVEIAAAVAVAASADHELGVRETVDAGGTTGADLVGAVGVVVGLMAPAALAIAAPGASLCGVTNEFVDVRFKYALYDVIAAAIPPRSAGIGVVADRAATPRIERVLTRSGASPVVQVDASELALLERRLDDARASVQLGASP